MDAEPEQTANLPQGFTAQARRTDAPHRLAVVSMRPG
jgi:hypothetical protein